MTPQYHKIQNIGDIYFHEERIAGYGENWKCDVKIDVKAAATASQTMCNVHHCSTQ